MWIEGCLFICMICLFLFLVIHLNSFLFIGKIHKAFVVWVLQIGQTSTPLQFVWILRAAIKFRKVQVMRGKTTHSLTPSEPNQGFSASNHRSYSRALCFLIWRKLNRKCPEIKLTFSRVFLFLRGAITLARATFQTIPNRSNLSKSARVGHLSTQITVFQLSSNGVFFYQLGRSTSVSLWTIVFTNPSWHMDMILIKLWGESMGYKILILAQVKEFFHKICHRK